VYAKLIVTLGKKENTSRAKKTKTREESNLQNLQISAVRLGRRNAALIGPSGPATREAAAKP
jgi:hypothetical protein